MSIEEKYKLAIQALQAIAQRAGADPAYNYTDEWTEAHAFIDCRKCAINTLKRLDEKLMLPNKEKEGEYDCQ